VTNILDGGLEYLEATKLLVQGEQPEPLAIGNRRHEENAPTISK
jgi:hypothetical protein